MFNNKKVQKRNRKKPTLNGYLLHAIELSGRTVKDGDEVSIKPSEISNAKSSWVQMTETQRQSFKDRAQALKIKVLNSHNRFNSIGQNMAEVEGEKNRSEEETNRRRNEIEHQLRNAADICELDTKVFYLLSTSHFFEDEKQIYPAEIGIAKFSLQDGVFDSMSLDINPGDLPIGSAYRAQQLADSTHKYPLPPKCPGESNYLKILLKIIDFLPPDEKLPIFYADGNPEYSAECKILQSAIRTLKLIFEEAQEYDTMRDLKVYPVIELLYYLKEITTEITNEQYPDNTEASFNSISHATAQFRITDCEFKYNASGCEYHEKLDAHPHCCLNKCTRYGYTISKWCAQGFKYKLKAGLHYPKKV